MPARHHSVVRQPYFSGCVVGRTGPRASDREGKARGLDVGKEPLAVLAESRPAELRVVDFIPGQRVGPAVAGHAHQVRNAVAVLRQDQAPLWGHGDVVGAVEMAAFRIRLGVDPEDSRKRDALGGGVVEPDLSVVAVGAAVNDAGKGGDEVGSTVAPPLAFALACPGDLVVPELLPYRGAAGVTVRNVDPLHCVARAYFSGFGEVLDMCGPE